MSKLKKWLDDLIGIEEIEEDIETIEEPVVKKPSAFLHEKARAPEPVNNNILPKPVQNVPINIFEPIAYKDCKDIADKLKKQEIVIVNYNTIPPSEAVKVYNFVKGCIFALDGTVEKVSNNVFIYSPKTVGLQRPYQRQTDSQDTLRFSWPDAKG